MRLALVITLLALVGCAPASTDHDYPNNDLRLLTSYTAKEACSCVFVMKQSDAFCLAWTRASPDLRNVRIDRDAGTVEAQSLLFYAARAHYKSARRGCVLE